MVLLVVLFVVLLAKVLPDGFHNLRAEGTSLVLDAPAQDRAPRGAGVLLQTPVRWSAYLFTPSRPMSLRSPPLATFKDGLNLYEYRCEMRRAAAYVIQSVSKGFTIKGKRIGKEQMFYVG